MRAITDDPSARHKKCDESPGACNNCVSTGRKCDGYDLARLPAKKFALLSIPPVASRLGWHTTADEMRSFSYFVHCSIPSLAAFFDSPLWRRVSMQMAHLDRAVYHAASMLGAIHEDSFQNQMRLSGEDLLVPRHRFAIEQASRAFSILNHRQASQDPQLREVVLLCCLLFVISDLLLGQYDSALQHLRGGLGVLKEALEQEQQQQRAIPLDCSLIETYQRLDVEFSHFGPGKPFLFADIQPEEEDSPDRTFPLHSLRDVHQRSHQLLSIGIPFLAKCWPLSDADIQADHDNLYSQQQRILSLWCELSPQVLSFRDRFYHKLSYREQRALELYILQFRGQIVGIKTCLFNGSVPAELVPDYEELMTFYDTFIARFPERPTITLDYGVLPSLYLIASSCPDYSIRLRAINALLDWPHCEAIINSNVVASLTLHSLKAELEANDQQRISCLDGRTDEELSQFLNSTLKSSQQAANWSTIRASKFLLQ